MAANEFHTNQPDLKEQVDTGTGQKSFLVLHNDDFHTFDFVIETLVNVCELDEIQAEQCTYLIHYKGKCDVKKGSLNFLKPFKDALVERGLEATIE